MEHNECRTLWVSLKPDTTERTAIGHVAATPTAAHEIAFGYDSAIYT
jgi:hypothetical protein